MQLFNYCLHLMFFGCCCCNHKQGAPPRSSFFKIKFFCPHEGLNEAFIYATTIKLTMAPIQFTAPCDGRKQAEFIFIIQNHKWQSVHRLSRARSGQEICPQRPRDICYVFCQQRPLAPFYSLVSKGKVSLEAVGEVEAGRTLAVSTALLCTLADLSLINFSIGHLAPWLSSCQWSPQGPRKEGP